MNLAKLSQEELLERCAWCLERIAEDQERFGAGLRVRPERKAEIVPHEGKLVPLQLATGREIIVIVTGPDSPARAAGDDLYIQLCSEECHRQIKAAIREEIS